MTVSCSCPISVSTLLKGTPPEQREQEDKGTDKGPGRQRTSPFGNRRLHRAALGGPGGCDAFAAGAARPCPDGGGAPGALRAVRSLQKPQGVAGRLLRPPAHARRGRAAARVSLRGDRGDRPLACARHGATPQDRPRPAGPAPTRWQWRHPVPAVGALARGRPLTLRDGPCW